MPRTALKRRRGTLRGRLAALVAGLFLALWPAAAARSASGTAEHESEYAVKAAFLYNFTKFVEWPAAVFPEGSSKLVIGVLGKDAFGPDLDALAGKPAKNRRVEVRRVSSPAEATDCHIVFVSTSEERHLPQVLGGLQGHPVLTVSDISQFTRAGGMIGFVAEGVRLRFQANSAAAEAAGLRLSSQLLKLSMP